MKTGKKIRKARSFYDMAQKELGELVGLSFDRISSYESGARNPKEKQLEEFSKALSIPMEYFTDHKIESVEDAFMIFFELEELYGLSIDLVKTSDSTDDSPQLTYALSFLLCSGGFLNQTTFSFCKYYTPIISNFQSRSLIWADGWRE